MRAVSLILFVVTLSGSVFAQEPKNKIQCWTDENGRRACGDIVPPRYAKQQREVVNERGIVVDTKPREKTREEVLAAEQEQQRAEEAQKKALQDAAYDRYLIESYRTVKDLEETRDARLGALNTRINLVQKAGDNAQATLDSLSVRAEDLKMAKKTADPKLDAQILEYQRSLADNKKALSQLQSERELLTAQFARDITRYQELGQISVSH
jgi:hypothetical protein